MSELMRVRDRARLLPWGYLYVPRDRLGAAVLRAAARRLLYSSRHLPPLTVSGAQHLAELAGPMILMVSHQGRRNIQVLYQILPAHLRRNLHVASFADPSTTSGPGSPGDLQRWYQRCVLGRFSVTVESASAGFEPARQLLQRGAVVAISGQQLRDKGLCLEPFYRGIAKLAFERQAPVVPVFLHGIGRTPLPADVRPAPQGIHVAIYPPHHFLRRALRDATATLQRVMSRADGHASPSADARW